MVESKAVVACFEVQPWEQEFLSERLAGQDLTFSTEFLVEEEAASRVKDAQVLSVFIRSRITRAILERLPRLQLVATRSTGYDHVDLAACSERGVAVANVPYYGENTVAEHTFGLILALSRNIHKAYQRTVRGDFSLEGLQGFDLKGKTLGVLGAGNIGLHVIRIAKGFGMEVVAYDVKPHHLVAEVLGFRYVSVEELLRYSDIVSLHLPYMTQTHHFLNKERFLLMKRGVLLINTARGSLVDSDALLWALDEGILAGAGLDVLEGEELIQEEKQLIAAQAVEEKLRMLLRHHALMRRDDVVVTPHIAFNSREAVHRIAEVTADNILGFLSGHPSNIVNR